MKKHILIGLLMLLPLPVAAQIIQPGIVPGIMGCDYYAAPAASGGSVSNDGKFASRPFRVSDFWSVATAGDTLCLLNGTYVGSTDMIDPPNSLAGASGNPIVIKALHPGGAFINGQFARAPAIFTGDNAFLSLEDVDACCSGDGRSVYSISDGAHNITLRRVCGWDPNQSSDPAGAGANVFQVHSFSTPGTRDILIEDFCAFGISNRMFRTAFDAADVTYRRGWARLEGGVSGETISTVNIARRLDGSATYENIIVTMDNHRNSLGDVAGSIFNVGGDLPAGSSLRLLGSLTYLLSGATRISAANVNVMKDDPAPDPLTINHFVAYHVGHNSRIIVGDCSENAGGNCANSSASNITSIGGNSPSIHSSFTGGNRNHGATLASVPNPFTGSNAANLCFRWVDGSVTSEPLWPWPMDARIQAAIQRARTIQTGTLSKLLVGGSVTAEVESILGTIPVPCRR